jgi:hypothetical protein
MAELYLGYAAFAHYIKENGYTLTKHQGIREELHIWLAGGGMAVFPLYDDNTRHICGCIYTNDEDIKKIFAKDDKTIGILLAECAIDYWGVSIVTNPHCHIPPSLKGVKTVIASGETIICKRKATS